MKYSVVFYCPDQHLEYNISTLNDKGVGGGVTSRVRMAHAISALDHDVTLYVNCPKDEFIQGVKYAPISQIMKLKTDIFIATTSGDGLDLSKACDMDISAKFRILMVHGVDPPTGIDCLSIDYVYVPSIFIRDTVIETWNNNTNRIFISHHGVMGDYFLPYDSQSLDRDPYAIVYATHPSKGLKEAIDVLNELRKGDSRFSLHIYGGYELWGENEQSISNMNGIYYHGLIGQRELAQRLQTCGFSLNLQTREEPFGMVVIEAMKAGCIVIASPVGAYPEIIQHGNNGFLVGEGNSGENIQSQTANLILEMIEQPEYCQYIRRNAYNSPLDWRTIAQSWVGHWNWVLSEKKSSPVDYIGVCSLCGGNWITLADGYHCSNCGQYQQSLMG